MPPLNTDTVFRTITLAHVPKITPSPTPMFVKSVHFNIGTNFAEEDKINLSKPKITVQMPLSPPLQLESNISTPIKHSILTRYLEGYDNTLSNFLVEGFQFGFKIPYQGARQFRLSPNLPSIKGKESILNQRLQQELLSNRIAGPFTEPPFPNIQVSPLGLVPRKSPGENRLIHHLSYPEGGSINHHIPPEFCTFQYQSVHTAIEIIKQLGKGALLTTTDIAYTS